MKRSWTAILATCLILMVHTIGTADGDNEPNDTYGTAEEISAGLHSGSVDDVSDYEDYFKFEVKGGDIISIRFRSFTVSDPLYLTIEDNDQYELDYMESQNGVNSTAMIYVSNETVPAHYYIIVEYWGSGNYEFYLNIDSQDDAESGNDAPGSYDEALRISPGQYNGYINATYPSDDEEDFYKFTAGEGDTINIEFTAYSDYGPIYLYLENSERVEVGSGSSIGGNGTSVEYWTAIGTDRTDWYLIIEYYGAGDYSINLTLGHQNDAGYMTDALEFRSGNITISDGLHQGALKDLDDTDFFRIPLLPSMVIELNLTSHSPFYQYLAIYEEGSEYQLGSISSSEGNSAHLVKCFENSYNNKWGYLRINGGDGHYAFRLRTWIQNDAGTEEDAHTMAINMSEASIIETGNHSGYLDLRGDSTDIFRVVVGAGQTLNISLEPNQDMMCGLWIYRIGGSSLEMDSAMSPGERSYVEHTFNTMETVSVLVMTTAGNGTYKMMVNISGSQIITVPGAPTNLHADNSSGSILLTWSPPSINGGSTITSYNIYRGLSQLQPKSYLATVDSSTLMYNDSIIVPGMTYYYTVSAFNSAGEGEQSNVADSVAPIIDRVNDNDTDGMDDGWEDTHGLDKTNGADGLLDLDSDGYSNYEEFIGGTDPTDPLDFPDIQNHDTDSDGMPDQWELENGLDPEDPTDAMNDDDNDGMSNLDEYSAGRDPMVNEDRPDPEDPHPTRPPRKWSAPLVVCGSMCLICVPVIALLLLSLFMLRKKDEKGIEE